MTKKLCSLCLILMLSISGSITAFAVEPFDNIPPPPGLIYFDYPLYYTADRITDSNGDTLMEGVGLRLYENIFRLTYCDKTESQDDWCFTALLPAGKVEMFGTDVTGLGDLTSIVTYWLVNKPASKLWLAPSLFVDAPIGQYDQNKPANLGSNVWKLRPGLLFAKIAGNVHVEANYKYNMYQKNRDTGTQKGNEHLFESYVGYYLKPNVLLGGHFNTVYGDDKQVDGNTIPDTGVRSSQIGASVNWMVSNTFGVLAENVYDYNTRNTTEGRTYLVRVILRI